MRESGRVQLAQRARLASALQIQRHHMLPPSAAAQEHHE